MSNIYTSADQLIGKTPLLELTHIEKDNKLNAKIYAKLEYFNPAGSVKDRIAKAMIDDAEEKGLLKEGSVIIEHLKDKATVGYGYNALTDTYGDMIEEGIVDPTKVTRSALQNASSVASTVLTTESLVADIKEPAPAAPAAPDMGGMY